jgi:uncharacterized repeat protein (TIGR03803 family)
MTNRRIKKLHEYTKCLAPDLRLQYIYDLCLPRNNCMRKFLITLIVSVLFISICSNQLRAQGVYQLWGATWMGGSSGYGTIFSVDGSGNHFRSRYSFDVQNPGFAQNYSTKLTEYNGKLYGTTLFGGGGTGLLNGGVLFEWDPVTNVYTKKIDFIGMPGELTLFNGKLYGTLCDEAQGSIFEYDPATNLYTRKIDLPGNNPVITDISRLTLYNNKFYGTVSGSNGLIYEWDPATNILTEKKDFDGTNCAGPVGGLSLYNAKLYGMTAYGGSDNGGAIYEWDPATNTVTKKFDFSASFLTSPPISPTGYFPTSALVFYNTKFYGMTSVGGSNDGGVLFQWDPVTNVFTKKFDFSAASGMKPEGELTVNAGKLYGITHEGGTYDGGSIFEWDPVTNTFNKKIDMNPPDGSNSHGSLMVSGGVFYGMTDNGGLSYNGVLFQWDPNTNIYTKKIDLRLNKGFFPILNLTYDNGKLYGVTADVGGRDKGDIFEWNIGSNQLNRKVDFATVNGQIPPANADLNPVTGAFPVSTLVAKDGKYYGIASMGGSNDVGVLFEWDPVTNVYTKKIDLVTGSGPIPTVETNMTSGLVLDNGRFYGTVPDHGATEQGELFEWDPTTNIYTKKIDFTVAGGSLPNAPIVLYNGKYYGTTIAGGANDAGVLFEWDPSTNVYTKKMDFAKDNNGYWPKAGLVVVNGKMYGSTYAGGTNDLGVLFEWDPATNNYTKKIDCDIANGSRPAGTMILNGQKLYGLTSDGGTNNKGVVFEWEPSNNTYVVKHHFNGTDGWLAFYETGAVGYNGLTLVPAPVATGTPGSCASYSPIVIDNTNNNTWVPLTDDNGDVVAEIKANGNNLGTINYSLYVNNGPVREDENHRLYLDRNLTITPQTQPSTPVDVRLYITAAEFEALKNATNSQGQPSGVTTINDVGFFKNGGNTCTSTIQAPASNITATGQAYDNGYVITASIPSFSTFYFAKNTFTTLPVHLLEFNAKTSANDVVVNWTSSNASDISYFGIERSEDGGKFTAIGKISAANSLNGKYHFTDAGAVSLSTPVIYYRLKQTERTGKEFYSGIIPIYLHKNDKESLQIYPNPADNDLSFLINVNKATQVKWSISDNNGKILLEGSKGIPSGHSNIVLNIASLSRGIYYLSVQGTTVNEKIRFVKK